MSDFNILIFYLVWLVIIQNTLGKSCFTDGKPNCCFGYQNVNGICKECKPGFTGFDCNQACGINFYGKGCGKKCKCEVEQRCDPVKGCLSDALITTASPTESPSSTTKAVIFQTVVTTISGVADMKDDSQPLTLIYFICVVAVLILMTLTALYVRFRLKKRGKVVIRQREVPKPTEHSDDMHNDEESDGIYCEIRESLMLDKIPNKRPDPKMRGLAPRIQFKNRCSLARSNLYNHLHFNKSLPDISFGNEYSHADVEIDIGYMNKSENCLSSLEFETIPENKGGNSLVTPEESFKESVHLNTHGRICKNRYKC